MAVVPHLITHRLLTCLHALGRHILPGRSVSGLRSIMCLAADIFEKIATETATLARYNKKPTVTSREIQTAGMLNASCSTGPIMMCTCFEDTVQQDKMSACDLLLLAFPDLRPCFGCMQCVLSYQESWQSMLCQRGPRRSPSSHQLEPHFAYQVDSGSLLAYTVAFKHCLGWAVTILSGVNLALHSVWCYVTLAADHVWGDPGSKYTELYS
jgi:hypothetical protein